MFRDVIVDLQVSKKKSWIDRRMSHKEPNRKLKHVKLRGLPVNLSIEQ